MCGLGKTFIVAYDHEFHRVSKRYSLKDYKCAVTLSKPANQTLPQVPKIEYTWILPFTAFELNYPSVPIMLNRTLR